MSLHPAHIYMNSECIYLGLEEHDVLKDEFQCNRSALAP